MKILIRLPNWLGDVVMSTAFINAVRQFHPGAAVDIIIRKELAGITELITGINKVYFFSKYDYPGLAGAYRFGKTLRTERYDLYFNLPHSLSSAVMARASGASQRVGFSKEGGFFLLTRSVKKPLHLHRVDEYLYLLEKHTGRPIINKQVELNAETDVNDGLNMVVVNFNSEAVSRRMPLQKGRNLLNVLTTTFPHTTFALIGSAKEDAFVSELISGVENPQHIINYAGKTDLAGLARLMACCKAVLTTDSGPAHLANAVGAPTVVLFGAGNEANTAPYNSTGLTVIRYGKLICEPCVRNTCKLYGVPKCMEMLDEIKIINSLSLHLNNA